MSEGKSIKLLLVDDEVDFLKSLSERLSLRDFEVTTASEGKQAIKAAKKGHFDVAILDLRMPGMDGTEVLKGRFRSRGREAGGVRLSGKAVRV
ncbi:MAG: response regulator [Deltaproteobacteria bacterium]|nr:response regulator [Deltaproteobacteria bacterium]